MSPPRSAIGRLGERLAAEHLEAAGYRILARNYRTRDGELDLIAADATTLVFCEVKARYGARSDALVLEFIGPVKRRQLRRMARVWLASDGRVRGVCPERVRFDAIGVTVDRQGRAVAIEHLPDAF